MDSISNSQALEIVKAVLKAAEEHGVPTSKIVGIIIEFDTHDYCLPTPNRRPRVKPRIIQGMAETVSDLEPPPIADPDRPRHSADYRSVYWNGQSFSFTQQQSAIIKILWENCENYTPEVGGSYLMCEGADNETGKIQDAFRGHPAWGTFLVPGTIRGTWKLAIEPGFH